MALAWLGRLGVAAFATCTNRTAAVDDLPEVSDASAAGWVWLAALAAEILVRKAHSLPSIARRWTVRLVAIH